MLFAELETIVSGLLSEGSREALEECWKLYKETVHISHPEGFYHSSNQDGTYHNLAVVGDGKVVDIEAGEGGEDRSITIDLCRAYSGVGLIMGPIPTLPRTQDSLLTVFCRITGSSSIGHFWIARNEDETVQLRDFARTMVEAISKG